MSNGFGTLVAYMATSDHDTLISDKWMADTVRINWIESTHKEIKSLKENRTWKSIPLKLLRIPCDLGSRIFPIESINPCATEGSEQATARSSTCRVWCIRYRDRREFVDVLPTVHRLRGVPARPRAMVIPRAVNFLSMTRAMPIGVGVINPDVCRLGRRRGVGIGVSTVYTHHYETHGSRQSKEQTRAWLTDARGLRLGEAKLLSGELGSITAHASFTSSARLNDVIPMGTQHRGTR
jgi:hypothetical protein